MSTVDLPEIHEPNTLVHNLSRKGTPRQITAPSMNAASIWYSIFDTYGTVVESSTDKRVYPNLSELIWVSQIRSFTISTKFREFRNFYQRPQKFAYSSSKTTLLNQILFLMDVHAVFLTSSLGVDELQLYMTNRAGVYISNHDRAGWWARMMQ